MGSLRATPGVGITLVWIIVMAALVAYVTMSVQGLVLGGLFGYLFSQVVYLRGAVGALQQRLDPKSVTEPIKSDAASAASTPALSSAWEPAPVAPTDDEPEPTPASINAAPPQTEDVPAARPRSELLLSAWLKPWIAKAVAWFKQGNPLARVGIVVLFFGGVFLAKYSADQGLLPLSARFTGLALGGIGLIFLGWRIRRRNDVYAQILQGGGIAGFYLTVFAATSLYGLLPQSAAMGLMVAVAVSAAILAVAQNSLSLAFIGTVGGFLTPILVSSGGGSHIALFTYYTILNLGIFVVAWFRAWRVLNLAGFIFTFGITGVFRGLSYSPEQLLSTDLFLLLFFVLYVAVSILFSIRQKPDLKGYVSGSLVFGLPLAAFGIHASLVAHIEYALAWSALGFGMFYALVSWALYLSKQSHLRLLCEAFAALAVIFASLAIPLAFDQQTTAAMWAVEGAGLLWIGIKQARMLARVFGLMLQAAGGIGYLMGLETFATNVAVLNSATVGAAMLSVAGFLSGYWLYRSKPGLGKYEQNADLVLGLWAVAWWALGGFPEIARSVASEYQYGIHLLFTITSSVLFYLVATRLVWPLFKQVAVATIGLTLLIGMFTAVQYSHPFAHLGYIAWPLAFGTAYFLLYRLEVEKAEWFARLHPWQHAGVFWLLTLLISWQACWYIGQFSPGVWRFMAWGLIPVLMIWVTIKPLKTWPFNVDANTYRLHAAAPMAFFVLAWIVVLNLSQAGSAQPLPYLPLLNPMDIGVGLALATLARYWFALSATQRNIAWPATNKQLYASVAGVVFLWLTAALVRALHQNFGAPWELSAATHSFLVQTSLSIFWGILGLIVIVFASRRNLRPVWIAGAGLMAVVVVKLFAIDLTGTDTLARIVSFLAVGGLLLLAGYLSPLPPKREEQAPAT